MSAPKTTIEPERRPLTLRDGYRTTARVWSPSREPRGLVIGLHGVQSHAEWYGYSARRLATAGFQVWWPDRRGSGRNRDRRGHADSGEQLIDDVEDVLSYALPEPRHLETAEKAGGLLPPVVLLGVSWGGKLAMAAADRLGDRIDAVALLYPALASRIEPARWQRALIRCACRCGLSRLQVADPALFTGDPRWQQFIAADPHALHRVSLGFLRATEELNDATVRALQHWRHPLLVYVAGRDRIVDNAAVERMLAAVPSGLLTYRCLSNAAHTLEFEPDRDAWIEALIAWVASVCERGKRRR